MADALIISSAEASGPLVAAAVCALGPEADLVVLAPQPPVSPTAELAAAAVARAVRADPAVRLVVAAAGLWGDEVVARVAAASHASCGLGVSDLACDDGPVWTWTRATHGGALEARWCCPGLLVASIECRGDRGVVDVSHDSVCVVALQLDEADARTAVLSRASEVDSVPLPAAERIVAGGRGLGGPDGFAELEQLGAAMGAEVAASRPPCDAGWISSSRQVGITGHKISAELYVAVGISGSVQHLAGIRGAGTVVAVNSDTDAPIFENADFGVVGDWREVVRDMRRALTGGET